MMYILAFLLGCGIFWFAYEVGKTIGGAESIEELERLRSRNECLQRSVDFISAELDHARELLNHEIATAHENVAGFLGEKIATAHTPVAPPRTDPITEWPLLGKWAAIPDSMNKEVLYGVGHMEMQRVAQERYTAEMRRKLDEILP